MRFRSILRRRPSARANLDQLQARISTACASGSAIGAVDKTGAPTCAFPAQVGAAAGRARRRLGRPAGRGSRRHRQRDVQGRRRHH